MERLKNYIILLRHNCITIAIQALEKLHNSNRVFYFDKDTGTIYMDGNWWSDFITSHSHTPDVYEMILLSLRTRFKATHLHLIYRNVPNVCFTWNDDAQMYLGKNGGYYKSE